MGLMAGLRIGLTGGIASGKSLVASRLAALGAEVVDADVLAREVVARGTEGLAAVVHRFGDEVLTAEGELDRPALGTLIFADPAARADLESIIHPRVRQRAAELVAAAGPSAIVVQVIPLLVETGQAQDFDQLVVVDLPTELQRQRLIERNHLTADQAEVRLAAQASREQRLAVADVVIANSGSIAHTLTQVDRLWLEWTAQLAVPPGQTAP